MNNFMFKCVFQIGQSVRNKYLKQHLNLLLETDYADIKALEKLQLERLKILIKHAVKYSPYYRNKLMDVDIDSLNINDLNVLPIIDKNDLLANMHDVQNNPKNEKLFVSGTSGSTGAAMLFKRNLEWDAAHRAAQLRGFSWYGIYPWMKNLYFWGFNPQWKLKLKMRFFDLLMHRWRVFGYSVSDLESAAKYLEKSEYIEGYSSSIFTLSKYLEKEGKKFNHIKMIKGTSEKIFDYYQEPVKAVFGQKLISEYGAAETGIIAFECPEGNMHIAMENVIVEEIEHKIVLTNLFSYSLPIIRYELGDYIELDKETKCACGRQHYIIKEVTGRIGVRIYGKKESYATLNIYYMFKNIALAHKVTVGYFGIQKKKGEIDFKIMYEGEDTKRIEGYINEQRKKFFGDDIDFNYRFVSGVEHQNKKAHAFESMIDDKGNLREDT